MGLAGGVFFVAAPVDGAAVDDADFEVFLLVAVCGSAGFLLVTEAAFSSALLLLAAEGAVLEAAAEGALEVVSATEVVEGVDSEGLLSARSALHLKRQKVTMSEFSYFI